jgi:hypothetical protein
MAIVPVISSPTGGRVDDVRALKFRHRAIAPVGTYATGGFTVTAKSVGLKRIVAVLNAGGLAAAADQATANEFSTEVSTNGDSITIFLYENAAAGSPSAEKTNGEATLTGQLINLIFLGY